MVGHTLDRPPDKSAYWKTILFILLIQNICYGYSKEPSCSHSVVGLYWVLFCDLVLGVQSSLTIVLRRNMEKRKTGYLNFNCAVVVCVLFLFLAV